MVADHADRTESSEQDVWFASVGRSNFCLLGIAYSPKQHQHHEARALACLPVDAREAARWRDFEVDMMSMM